VTAAPQSPRRDPPTTLLHRGLAAHRAGDIAAAEALYREVLASEPTQADALFLLATICLGQRRVPQAVALLKRAVAAQPGFAQAHQVLGEALEATGDIPAAIAACRAALTLRPGLAEAHQRLGRLLFGRRETEAAAASFRAAAALRPEDASTHNNLAIALQTLGDSHGAVAAYRRALALQPDAADIHSNLGCSLLTLNDRAGAAASHRRALALRPGYPAALTNLAGALAPSDPDTAIACYREVLAPAAGLAGPALAEAHYSLGLLLLREGRYQEGWAEAEWWDRTPLGIAGRRFDSATGWDGTQGDGTLLVYAQQGLGDPLQFARFLALAAARRPVVLEAPRSLQRLLATLAPVRSGRVRVQPPGAALPPHDATCSLLGLPHRLGITLANLPGDMPYLHAEPEAAARWAGRLAALPGLKVGLVWAGTPLLGGRASPALTDRRRSLALVQFAGLAEIAGVSFVSLQKGEAARQTPPPGLLLHDWTGELHDLADTAALVAGLDLVISVDTAVAHLAGALGRPVWLLNRWDSDWRWLRGRDDSPWYPSLRQFRQRAPGAWEAPLATLCTALAELAEPNPGVLYNRAHEAAAAGQRQQALATYDAAFPAQPGYVWRRWPIAAWR
jgi:tetratricopeptide (TPR) repeat protein